MKPSNYYCRLPHRSLLSIQGTDSESFLQGLISLNMTTLKPGMVKPGLFLNAKGRILYHVLAYRLSQNELLFDCDTTEIDEMEKTFNRFKLRKKVEIRKRIDLNCWTSNNNIITSTPPATTVQEQIPGIFTFQDPRPGRLSMLSRIWAPAIMDEKTLFPATSQQALIDGYHAFRICEGIPETSKELKDEIPFLLNMDYWPETLVYDKGCYTGQELIARTHFKGVVRKRILPFVVLEEEGEDTIPSNLASWIMGKQQELSLIDFNTMESTIKKSYRSNQQKIATGLKLFGVSPSNNNKDNTGVITKNDDLNEEGGSILSLSPNGKFGLAIIKNVNEFVEQQQQTSSLKFPATHRVLSTNGTLGNRIAVFKPLWWLKQHEHYQQQKQQELAAASNST
jgi:folate-binding protein YgfZ